MGYYVIPDVSIENLRETIAAEIGHWLDCWKKDTKSGVSDFALRWIDDHGRWELRMDYHGLLFAAIALQLALVVADVDSLFTCSGCGIPYIRPRHRKRPKTGWANYCDRCAMDGVATRRATETYRKKRSQAVRLRSGGASIPEIAEQLNAESSRVRRWVKTGGEGGEKKARQ
jgi:hypothetical protein